MSVCWMVGRLVIGRSVIISSKKTKISTSMLLSEHLLSIVWQQKKVWELNNKLFSISPPFTTSSNLAPPPPFHLPITLSPRPTKQSCLFYCLSIRRQRSDMPNFLFGALSWIINRFLDCFARLSANISHIYIFLPFDPRVYNSLVASHTITQ